MKYGIYMGAGNMLNIGFGNIYMPRDFQECLIKRKPYLLMISDEEMTLSQVLDDRFPLIHM